MHQPKDNIEILVLLVSDESDIIDKFSDSVRRVNEDFSGNHVTLVQETAYTFERACNHLEEYFVDVIFLDINLPDAQGVREVENLTQRFPGIPVVVLTRLKTWELILDTASGGGRECLLKQDISPEAILSIAYHAYEQKQFNDRLRESQEEYRALVEHLPEGMFRKDLSGEYRFVNKAFADLLKLPVDEIRGETNGHLFVPECASALSSEEENVVREQKWMESQMILTAAQGSSFIAQISRGPVVDAEGEVIGVQGIVRDVTESEKRLDEQRRLDRFEGMVAMAERVVHGVREKLATVIFETDLLRDKYKNTEIGRIIQGITNTLLDAGRMIEHLALLSGKQTQGRGATDIPLLFSELEHRLNKRVPDGIELLFHVDQDLPKVNADLGSLLEVLERIAENAWDASPRGGRVSFSASVLDADQNPSAVDEAESVGPVIVIRIQDTGRGISKDLQHRVFDPFFTTKDSALHEGTGLAKCMAIVKKLNGSIRIDPLFTNGASFEITVPAQVDSNANQEDSPGIGNDELILLVEDDAHVRNSEAEFLGRSRLRVLTAPDGASGLTQFAEQADNIDVVITDLLMPHLDGIDLIKGIRELNESVPIIVTTGLLMNAEIRSRLENLGVNSILEKPYSSSLLLEQVLLVVSSKK